MDHQLSLFSTADQWQVQGRTPQGLSPQMSKAALRLWQERLGDFQRSIRFLPAEEQTSLFEGLPDGPALAQVPAQVPAQISVANSGRAAEAGASYTVSPPPGQPVPPPKSVSRRDIQQNLEQEIGRLDPFMLPQKNINFWQAPVQEAGVAALYFVIDYERSLLLYVGETIHSNQRWKGVHDCKRYLAHYRQIHYTLGLTTQLGIAFWPHAPRNQRARQRLESQLIRKWRPPFNKENWSFWGTPFVS